MKFSTKAKNLLFLNKLELKRSKIPKFYKFYVKDVLKKKSSIIKIINKNLGKKICIRSSYFLEDKFNNSMAGEFEGVSNIKNTKKKIINGIDQLLKQYKSKTNSKKIYNNSEIIFQNYLLTI